MAEDQAAAFKKQIAAAAGKGKAKKEVRGRGGL